ncbi:IS110 family transposase [Maritalea sp. S77]|uniref:IS110 family transposase n=1 Tax=Maritalea sp. S77 TaxID=3415125 RepID=UPI003C79C43F
MQIITIGVDLAKNVIQVHGVYEDGSVAFNKPLRRAQMLPFFAKLAPCLIGIEACASSHYWARELTTLGHEVKLMPATYVKAYVKRGKSDAADAAAICEAVTRPSMRFVAIKTEDQQAILSQHSVRQALINQRTQLVNMIRGLLAEFGIIIPRGIDHLRRLAREMQVGELLEIPESAEDVIALLCDQLIDLDLRIARLDKTISEQAKQDERIELLRTIPGIGPLTASAIVATIGNGRQFRSARDFAAWIGLTPLNKSSGGKQVLGRISRMGNQYLRKLLVNGMASRVRAAKTKPERADPWMLSLLERKPVKLAAVAMANKTARIAWAVLTNGEPYREMSTT